MKELTATEIKQVNGGSIGHVGSCVAVGRLGMSAGAGFGPWGVAGGALGGCLIGIVAYSLK
ncbi:hypothetical protein [Microbulbifer pacificus]|uniref:hypothetical protein n=1 Tax=Microbulbifer pacificus TaxID=407164 RepID=UPI000CF3B4B8|nr:hypothetical protein [Microbulbifer pacificus]